MSQRAKLAVILFTWFLTTGSQWDLVQTFGWGRMIVRNAEKMPVGEAVQRTFGGEMCEVCHAVRHAKEQEKQSTPPAESLGKGKLIMLCPPAPRFVFTAPARSPWSHSDRYPLSAERPAPPTPPPRWA